MERTKLGSTKKTGAVNARSERAPVKKAERKPKKQRSSCAATAGVTISLRASSSDAIAAVGSVSASGTARRRGRRRRRSRSSAGSYRRDRALKRSIPFLCAIFSVRASPRPGPVSCFSTRFSSHGERPGVLGG